MDTNEQVNNASGADDGEYYWGGRGATWRPSGDESLPNLNRVRSINGAFRDFLPQTSVVTPLYVQSVMLFASCTMRFSIPRTLG